MEVLDPFTFRNKDIYIFGISLDPENDENNFGAICENSCLTAPPLIHILEKRVLAKNTELLSLRKLFKDSNFKVINSNQEVIFYEFEKIFDYIVFF